jgi:DNA-binding NarL/FixJ family response regulator
MGMTTTVVSESTNILIVDDHKLVTKLISNHFDRQEVQHTIRIANGFEDAIGSALSNNIDIALLDVMLPDGDGIELAKRLIEINSSMKIIFLTALNSKKIILDAVKLGAVGFLSKTSHLKEINEAIEFVKKGEKYFCQDSLKILVGNSVDGDVRNDHISDSDKLTDREKEILRLVVDEYTIAEIAEHLSLSRRTVETHKRNLMAKLGAKSTISLVKMVYENKIL